MLEVLLGEMYSQSSTILKHIERHSWRKTQKYGGYPVCFRIVCLRMYYTVCSASFEQKSDTNCKAKSMLLYKVPLKYLVLQTRRITISVESARTIGWELITLKVVSSQVATPATEHYSKTH
jgi:hypothetical protein